MSETTVWFIIRLFDKTSENEIKWDLSFTNMVESVSNRTRHGSPDSGVSIKLPRVVYMFTFLSRSTSLSC